MLHRSAVMYLNDRNATQWHLQINSCSLGSFGTSVYFLWLFITRTCVLRRLRQGRLIYVQRPCWFRRRRWGVHIFAVIWGTSCSRKPTHLGPSSLAQITVNVFLGRASDSGGVCITGAEWFQISSTVLGRKDSNISKWRNTFPCTEHQHVIHTFLMIKWKNTKLNQHIPTFALRDQPWALAKINSWMQDTWILPLSSRLRLKR